MITKEQLAALDRFNPMIRYFEEDGEDCTEIMNIPYTDGQYVLYDDLLKLLGEQK